MNLTLDAENDPVMSKKMEYYLDLEKREIRKAWMDRRAVDTETEMEFEQWFCETYEC
jgi:hypothetical protein